MRSWAETLSTVSDVLEEWIKVQRSWLYLQPIFDSSDIQRQLPTEYKRFSTVDKNWRQVGCVLRAVHASLLHALGLLLCVMGRTQPCLARTPAGWASCVGSHTHPYGALWLVLLRHLYSVIDFWRCVFVCLCVSS